MKRAYWLGWRFGPLLGDAFLPLIFVTSLPEAQPKTTKNNRQQQLLQPAEMQRWCHKPMRTPTFTHQLLYILSLQNWKWMIRHHHHQQQQHKTEISRLRTSRLHRPGRVGSWAQCLAWRSVKHPRPMAARRWWCYQTQLCPTCLNTLVSPRREKQLPVGANFP